MAYLTVKDIEPKKLLVEPRSYGLANYHYEDTFTNERSFPHFVPITRFARRLELSDELVDPLYDWPKLNYLGDLCPVIDSEALGAKRIKELKKFLPKHMELRVNDLGEMYIVENFDVVDRLFEQYWEVMRDFGLQRWTEHLGSCSREDHQYCYYAYSMWRNVSPKMTSGQFLRRLFDESTDIHRNVFARNAPLYGTDYGQGTRYSAQIITDIWEAMKSSLCPNWQLDVHFDGHIPLSGYSHDGNLLLNYLNHKLRNKPSVQLRLQAKIAAAHGCNTVHDAYLKAIDKPMESRSCGGEHHERFEKTCRANYADAFINRLRPSGDGNHVKGRKRRIEVVDHNYANFDPMLPCLVDGASGWMTFGLSLAREKPALFTIADRDIANRPLQRELRYEKPEARLLVHHTNSIWRFVALVPYWYWKHAARRYHMGMMIGMTLEDRECGVNVPFPVMRGFDAEMKAAIENTPFMSSAIQHAMYKLQFLLKDWDREHCTQLDLGYGTYAQMMPLTDAPQRMACCRTYRSYDSNYQGTISNVLYRVRTAFEPSDLWRSKEREAQMQRVARSVQVEDAELRMAIEAEPELVRNRVLRLDA